MTFLLKKRYFLKYFPSLLILNLFFWASCFPVEIVAQNHSDENIRGLVFELKDGKKIPLPGATVLWKGTVTGTNTINNGEFILPKMEGKHEITVSFVGYKTDTIHVSHDNQVLQIRLYSDSELEAVEVEEKQNSTRADYLNPRDVQIISEKELYKAACCNLSESFETNASVDVSFSDAITGTKQIEMLGLSGRYTLITTENLPAVRGLASVYGLNYISGSWIESIQVSKGAGSVVNGFESMAGQINVEMKKPEEDEKLYLNTFANQGGRMELNAIYRTKVSENLHSSVLAHGEVRPFRQDMNGDGFTDFPEARHFDVMNRWIFNNGKGLMGQFGLKYLTNSLTGGQLDFDAETDRGEASVFGFETATERTEAFGKLGYVFSPGKSIGFQTSVVMHGQDNYFGLTDYNADQTYFYNNLIYQTSPGHSEKHEIKTGLSFVHDSYREKFAQPEGLNADFRREESTVGAFTEYSYTESEKLSLIAGLRADYHNLFGFFFTPRLHSRYQLTDLTVIRASAGRGQRTANIFADNTFLFASSRSVEILSSKPEEGAYGLKPEVSWNYGAGFSQDFTLDYREGTFTVDYYLTDFQNQVVTDTDENAQRILFYNLDGRSFSHSIQAEASYELIQNLDLRLAYRFLDVQTDYLKGRLERPLISRHRAFMNLAYETRNDWTFDLTLQWFGSKRLPSTAENPEEYRRPDRSPDFFLLNGQIAKSWNKKFDAYLGVENILNFRQNDPIIAVNEPFSEYFDSSLVWGPIFGRMFYAGMRFRLK